MFSSTPAVSRSRQSPSPVKMPRPFSVSIFKGPTLAASQGPVNSKFGAPPQSGGHMGWFPSWSLFNSHFAGPKPAMQRAGTYPPYMSGPTPSDNRSIPQNFYIYPNSHVNGAYIYETSFSSKSEVFSTSDYDSSSSASYTPSSFSPILSSTDSLVTASSSSPTHPTTSLPSSASDPKPSSDNNSRSFYPSQVSNGGYGPSQGSVRNEPASAPRFNGYNGPQRPQIGYLSEATPPMADDHRTLLNTEYNAWTSHYPPFRGASANASHSGTDYRSDNASSVASNPSEIMLHPPSSSPERQGTGDANRPTSSTNRYETSSRTSPHDVNLLPEPPNRLQLVPLPPVSEDGSSRGPHQSNASSRRDSTFMPYYFPDPLSVASYPQQYTSQNAGGDSLPFPPGLVFPDVPLRRSPDSQSATEMRSDSPSTDSAISGHDFAGIRILTYNASVEGSTLRGGPDVGSVNSQPRDGHATQATAPEPRRRSYASVAASRPGSALSSSTSSTLIDQQAPSAFSQAQLVPPFPIPAPPATSGQPGGSVADAPQSRGSVNSVPPIPVAQFSTNYLPPRRASPETLAPSLNLSRQSPVNDMTRGNSRQPSQVQPPPEYGRVNEGGIGRSPPRDLQARVPETRPRRGSIAVVESSATPGSSALVTIPSTSQKERSSSPPQVRHASQSAAPATSPVAGRIRKDSLSCAHMRIDAAPHIPSILPAQTPSMPVRDVAQQAEYPPLGQRQSSSSAEQRRPMAMLRRHSTDGTEGSREVSTVPYRRHSDGDQVAPHMGFIPARTVRWNENLICPSPIFPDQRRKGWFNKRGDQLWTNKGTYKTPEPGMEYPLDLEDYPEHGEGWMNEHGVRIDMNHRLVPKVPLRSALKTRQAQAGN